MGAKLTLGLFISSSQNMYEVTLYKAVCDVAHEVNANVICLTSGALRAYKGFEFQRNVFFDMVNELNLDGLIISGTLAHPVSRDEMLTFFTRYEKIPTVSIAVRAPGIPNVMVDSHQGMQAIVEHLIKVHRYTKFAFIRGPLGHEEAEERCDAFVETLSSHRIKLNPDLIVCGDYSHASGTKAAQELLARSGAKFDCIVSANDTMALGALEVLREAAIAVPGQVAITGFDDTNEGRFDQVPLTTVRQNIYDQGILAARILIKKINNEDVPEKSLSPAPLVIRKSCGCTAAPVFKSGYAVQRKQTWQETLNANFAYIASATEMALSHLPSIVVNAWCQAWLSALINSLEKTDSIPLLQAFESSLLDSQELGVDLAAWHHAISTFFEGCRYCMDSPAIKAKSQKLEIQSLLKVGEVMERLENTRQIEYERRDMALRGISESLMTTFDMVSALEVLEHDLPHLNIRSFYLCLFEDPQRPTALARLIFAMDSGQRISLPEDGIIFQSTQFLPPQMNMALESHDLVMEALYSKEDRLGFIILEVEPKYVQVCNALRALLSGALQGVLLLEQRRRTEVKLLESENELKSTVANLKFANQELESFAYSISHDLRAPLRAIVGFSAIIEREYHHLLDEEAQRLFARIAENGKRMGMLIDGLLSFSRMGRQQFNIQTVDMHTMVQEVCRELTENMPNRKIVWALHDIPPAQADPQLIKQVWINLVSNAIKYTARRETAQIEIGWLLLENIPTYFIRDNGAGFDMAYADKLFGVFNRLHHEDEFEGTGIGLALSKRIVTRQGGNIWAESKVDEGATFYFTLGRS